MAVLQHNFNNVVLAGKVTIHIPYTPLYFSRMDLLPREVQNNVLCHLVCRGQEIGTDPECSEKVDIVYCNPEGYLVEVYNKKVVNSCHLGMEDASKIYIYFNYGVDTIQIYYLVKNNNGKLLVVKKVNTMLLVVKQYENIRDCKLYDFENKGYPQIRVNFLDNDDLSFTHNLEFDERKLGVEKCGLPAATETLLDMSLNDVTMTANCNSMEVCQETENEKMNSKFLSDFLSNKLKGMEMYVTELNYELYNLNEVLENKIKEVSLLSDLSPHSNQITKSWYRVNSSHWFIGIEICSTCLRDTKDLDMVLRSQDFSKCKWKVIQLSHTSEKELFEGTEEKADGADAEMNRPRHEDQLSFLRNEQEPHSSRRRGDGILERDNNPDVVSSIPSDNAPRQVKYAVIVALNIPDFESKSKFSAAFTFLIGKRNFSTEKFHLTPENVLNEKCQMFSDENEESLSEDVMCCLCVSTKVNLCLQVKYELVLPVEELLIQRFGFKKRRLLNDEYYIKEKGYLCGTIVTVRRVPDPFVTWKLSVFIREVPMLYTFVNALANEIPVPVRIRMEEDN